MLLWGDSVAHSVAGGTYLGRAREGRSLYEEIFIEKAPRNIISGGARDQSFEANQQEWLRYQSNAF